MSVFSGLSGLGTTGVAAAGAVGAVAVGAAVWVGVLREDPAPATPETVAALPQTAEPTLVAEPEPAAEPKAQPQAETEEVAETPTEDAPAEDVAEAPAEDSPAEVVAEAPAEDAPAEDVAEAATEGAPSEEVAEAPTEESPAEEETAALPAPSFDEVRRESDGMTVIAGQAAPRAKVSILLDGEEVANTTADGSGKFATLTMIAPDGQGHVLTLSQSAEGQVLASNDQIILAPLDPPVVVAEVEEAPEEVVVAEIAPEAEPEVKEEEPVVTAEVPSETEEVETASVPEAPEVPEEVAQEPASQAAEAEEPVVTETAEAPAVQEPEADVTETAEVPATEATETVTAEAETVTEPVKVDEPQTQQVAVLKATDDGVELLNTTPPEVMENVAIDTISYSEVGEVQLAGRAQTEARAVRVYLDNTAIVSLSVDDQGRWRGDLPDVDEGIYTLRVDEVAEDGSVTSRVETPFKREDPEVLAVATEGQDGPLKRITVQSGNTLWAIAEERYGNGLLYVKVFNANQSDIRDPDLIYPGQIFDLPDQ